MKKYWRKFGSWIFGIKEIDTTTDKDLFKKIEKSIFRKREVHKSKIDDANDFEERLFSSLYEDNKVDEELRNLFHRLNYQRVVDKMSKRITNWKFTLLALTAFTIVGLYISSVFFDPLVPKDNGSILSDYERMMSAIDLEVNWQKHGHAIWTRQDPDNDTLKDSTFVELSVESITPREGKPNLQPLIDATSSFWTVYYIRYMLVRIFISVVLFLFINSAIKVYMRLRRDRMSLIYREEATTTILYFIQKYLTTKNHEGEKVVSEDDKRKITKLLPMIASELYHNPEMKVQKDNSTVITDRLFGLIENLITSRNSKKN